MPCKTGKENEKGDSNLSVKMGNNSKLSVIRRENIILEDEIGSSMNLKNTRVVEGMVTNVISLLQLVVEGWKMVTTKLNGRKIIQMKNKNGAMTFVESEKKHLCFLSAKTVTTEFVGNINHNSDDDRVIPETEMKTTDGVKLLPHDYNELHDKHGHHGDAKLRSLATKLGFKLTASIKNCDA